MAINVAYNVPAALLQAEVQKEKRAFNRQKTLLQMQQSFQREQANAAYAHQLAMQQFNQNAQAQTQQRQQAHALQTQQNNFDNQMAMLEAKQDYAQQQRAWQLEDRQSQWNRQDALLQSAQQMQSQQEADALEKQMWQQSEILRQQAEKQYAYTDAQKEQLAALSQSERDLSTQYVKGMLTPDEYTRALKQIRIQRSSIMPETPILQEDPQKKFMEENVRQVPLGNGKTITMVRNGNGKWEAVRDNEDTEDRKRDADRMKTYMDLKKEIMGIAKEYIKSGKIPPEEFDAFVDEKFDKAWAKTPFGLEEAAQKKREEEERKQLEKQQAEENKRIEEKEKLLRKQQEQQRMQQGEDEQKQLTAQINRIGELEKLLDKQVEDINEQKKRIDKERRKLEEEYKEDQSSSNYNLSSQIAKELEEKQKPLNEQQAKIDEKRREIEESRKRLQELKQKLRAEQLSGLSEQQKGKILNSMNQKEAKRKISSSVPISEASTMYGFGPVFIN